MKLTSVTFVPALSVQLFRTTVNMTMMRCILCLDTPCTKDSSSLGHEGQVLGLVAIGLGYRGTGFVNVTAAFIHICLRMVRIESHTTGRPHEHQNISWMYLPRLIFINDGNNFFLEKGIMQYV